MRGYNKPNPQQNTKKTDSNLIPKRVRYGQAVVNPEVGVNRFKTNIKNTAISRPTFLRNQQPTLPKKQNTAKNGINRFRKTNPDQAQQKQLANRPKKFFSRPAPSNQFKKYLSDTDNVFYEDSPDMKNLRRIKVAKFYLTIFVIIMAFCYIGIGRIVPLPKEKCPPHANCNVFIHCHKGYARRNNTCIIDPQIVNKAKEISQAVVTQLSYNYGEQQCLPEGQSLPVSNNILQVFKEFNVEDGILKEEIMHFFINKQNQEHYQFNYRLATISAQSKLYSLSCSATLFIRSSSFKYYFLTFVLLIFGVVKLLKVHSQYKSAKLTYSFLKAKTLCENELCISDVKKEAEGLYGQWTQHLWEKVDKIRSQDGCIAYYVELEQLYWKKLG